MILNIKSSMQVYKKTTVYSLDGLIYVSHYSQHIARALSNSQGILGIIYQRTASLFWKAWRRKSWVGR